MTNDPQSLVALVDEATRRGITLWAAADGKLGFRAPNGALTNELRANLAAHRDALVDMISGPKVRAHGPIKQVPFLEYYATGFWKAIRSGKIGVSYTNGPNWIAQVDGPFSAAAFAASVDFVASRHDILNMTIREFDDMPHFCWERAPSPQLVELPAESAAPDSPDLLRVLTDIVWRPFEPEVDILFRPFVVAVSESRHVIGFVLNHLIGDGFSVGMIREELLYGYELALTGNLHEPFRPDVQYTDYILAMNAWLASPARDYRLAYWRRQLDGIAPCKPPVDHVLEADEQSEIGVYDFTYRPGQTEVVHRLARELSTTAYFVLVAAYARALSVITGQPDVAIVSLYHGRDNPAITTTIGSMQNQLLLRIPAAQNQPFKSLVRECQRIQNEALEFQFPLGPICQLTPGAPPQTAYPELNCSFASTPAVRATPPAAMHSDLRSRTKPYPVPNPNGNATRAREFPGIKLALRADDSAIRGCLVYLASEYDAPTIAHLAELIASVEPAEHRFAVG